IDKPLALQVAELIRPSVVIGPVVIPSMQLEQVKALDTGILEALVYKLFNMIRRVTFFQSVLGRRRPFHILRRNLARRVEFLSLIRTKKLSKQIFTPAVSIDKSRIEKIAAEI